MLLFVFLTCYLTPTASNCDQLELIAVGRCARGEVTPPPPALTPSCHGFVLLIFPSLTADTTPLHYCLGPARTPGESLASHRPHFKRNENTDTLCHQFSAAPLPTLRIPPVSPPTRPPPTPPPLSSPSTSSAKQRSGSHMDQSELPQWERVLVISGLMSDGGLKGWRAMARQRLSSWSRRE